MMRGLQEAAGVAADRALARDAALIRISRTRRWTLAGAAALTAGLAALASALLPGKSFGAKAHRPMQATSQTAAANPHAAPPLPAPADPAQLGLGQSSQAPPVPQPTPAPAPATAPQAPAPSAQTVVVSGGS
jgi:hypothetical protein